MILNFKLHENSMMISTMCGTQPAVGPISNIESMEHYCGRRIDSKVEMRARLLRGRLTLEEVASGQPDLIFQEIDKEFLDEFKLHVSEMSPHYDLTFNDTLSVSNTIIDTINLVADEILNNTGVHGNVAWISPEHLMALVADGGYAPTHLPQGTHNHVGMIIDPIDETRKIKVYCDFSLKDNIFVGYKTNDVDAGIVFAPYMILSYGNVFDPILRKEIVGLLLRYAWWAGTDHDRFKYYGVIDIKGE